MISHEEIEAKAREFEIHPANVQRDYIFGWLLWGLFTTSGLRDDIFLKGGNALRKGYFEHTRFSSDLDFGIPGDVSQEVLLAEINAVCAHIQERTGVAFIPEDTRVEEKFSASETPLPELRVYEARVYFRDFSGQPDHIRIKVAMDVTRFDRVLLPLQTVPLIHPYSDAAGVACNIRCMKLEEIIATKLKCLLQRQHAPDLFDYAYSIKLLGGTLDKQEVVTAFVRKTIFERNPHVLKAIMQQTPLDYFKEFWTRTIVCASSAILEAEEAIQIFIGDLEALFSIYPDNGYRDFAFFGPELRVPIMKAGREQTLLRLRYKGEERLVEPYSLKYMEGRRGEREYFYGFNCSGGSNPPGIRMFVSERIETIQNTSEKFKPRFQIELSKAGERPEKPYLFDPNRPARAPRSRAAGSYVRTLMGHPKYTYQCTFCGRQFMKSKQGATLRPHKDSYGNDCGGKSGYYVGMQY